MLFLIIKIFLPIDIEQSNSLIKAIHQIRCRTEPHQYPSVVFALLDCARLNALIPLWQIYLEKIIPTTWTRWSAATSVGVLTLWPLLNPAHGRCLPWNAISIKMWDLKVVDALTCIPGCSQNNGIDPRIWMKDETLSSRKITCGQHKQTICT